jgi:hypothetical protein
MLAAFAIVKDDTIDGIRSQNNQSTETCGDIRSFLQSHPHALKKKSAIKIRENRTEL